MTAVASSPAVGRNAANDAAEAVLSACLVANAVPTEAAAILQPAMFEREAHRLIWAAMVGISGRRDPIDPVTIQAELDGDLDRAGGMEYIAALIDVVPTAAHAAAHAQIVREAWQRRELGRLGKVITEAPHQADLDGVSRAIDRANALMLGITAAGTTPTVRSLRQLLEDPDAGKPPTAMVTRLAWAGRVVQIAGPEGCGKTTLAGAGAARHTTGGQFLDGLPGEPGAALWINLEEHRADVVRRAVRFHADADRFLIQERPSDSPLATILQAIATVKPAVTVIDSIHVLASLCGVVDTGNAGQWQPVLTPLVSAARDSGTAMVWIGQAKKSDGSYRDSSSIGHAADAVLEIPAPEVGSARRRIRVKKARWELREFTVELTGDAFHLVSLGELSIDARVLAHVTAHPRCSKSDVRSAIGGRAEDTDAALARLVGSDAVRNTGNDRRHQYEAVGAAQGEGNDDLPF